MMPHNHQKELEQLLALVHSAVQRDNALREQFQIGEKFRFIRDKLEALQKKIEALTEQLQQNEVKKAIKNEVHEDEMLVWVYLYNAQGLLLQTWQKLLIPKVFYEYSVNRPIYGDKAHVESLIRQKSNKVQHGYAAIVVKKADVLPEQTVDVCDNPVLKVKEGALKFEKLVSFTHNDCDYVVSETGMLE